MYHDRAILQSTSLIYATQFRSATPSTETIGAHEAQEPLQDTGKQR
jgi:hypothetical protein